MDKRQQKLNRFNNEQRYEMWMQAIQMMKTLGKSNMPMHEFQELLDLVDVDTLSRRFNPTPIPHVLSQKAARIRVNFPEYKDLPIHDLIYEDIWHKCNMMGKLIDKSDAEADDE